MPGNRSFYKNEKVDQLIRKALTLSDQQERTSAVPHEAQDIIMVEVPPIFFFIRPRPLCRCEPEVKGYVFNPMLESMYNFESIYKE